MRRSQLRSGRDADRSGIGRPAQLRPIQGALDAATAPVKHVSVDHRHTSNSWTVRRLGVIRPTSPGLIESHSRGR
jgi:hypothetical protein